MKLGKIVLSILAPCFLILNSSGQTTPISHVDSVGMQKAIYLISIGHSDSAMAECRKMLVIEPIQVDANILLARLYSWNCQFDSARMILLPILKVYNCNLDAINVLTNVELWSKNYFQAMEYVDEGIRIDPRNKDLLIKKVKILIAQSKYQEALDVINQIVKIYPESTEFANLIPILNKQKGFTSKRSALEVNFRRDWFSKGYTPWNSVSTSFYTRKKWGVLLAGLNYSHRYRLNGTQISIGILPQISTKINIYIGGTYSKGYIFPNYSFSGSLFYKKFGIAQLEAGVRYLKYKIYPSAIIIYQGGINVSVAHWRYALHTYLIPVASKTNQAYFISVRYLFCEPYHSLMLSYNRGISPNNLLDTLNFKGYFFPKESNMISCQYQKPILANEIIIKVISSFERNEYLLNNKRNRISFGIGIEKIF